MKIAIIDMDNLNNPFWNAGQARATREVSRVLAKTNDVTVYSAKYPNWKDYEIDGIKYRHMGLCVNSAVLTNIFWILTVPFIVKNIKADIIIENFNAPTSVSFAPLFTDIPVVALPTMFNAKEFRDKYHLPFDLVEKIGLRFYKYIMPYSTVGENKAKALNPKITSRIIPQGVSNSFFAVKQKSPKYILFLGRFDNHQKGIDLLLNAYNLVKNEIKFPLVIAGHGPDASKIKEQIKKLSLEKQVIIYGPTYGKEKDELASSALFTAFPSRHDEMSIWSLESLAYGLPLVCFDLPEAKWVPPSVSLKAAPFAINEYAKLLLEATNKDKIIPLRKNTRAFAKNFQWENVARDFLAFFSDILAIEKRPIIE